MKKTKFIVKPTTQFRKDYKLAMKRGLKIALLEEVVEYLAMGEPLPEKNRDHALPEWEGQRDQYSIKIDSVQFSANNTQNSRGPGSDRNRGLCCAICFRKRIGVKRFLSGRS